MPIRVAFSTVACPKWDFETIAARAKEYGYEGVEIRGGDRVQGSDRGPAPRQTVASNSYRLRLTRSFKALPARNAGTGAERTAVTDSSGAFHIVSIPAGSSRNE